MPARRRSRRSRDPHPTTAGCRPRSPTWCGTQLQRWRIQSGRIASCSASPAPRSPAAAEAPTASTEPTAAAAETTAAEATAPEAASIVVPAAASPAIVASAPTHSAPELRDDHEDNEQAHEQHRGPLGYGSADDLPLRRRELLAAA